MPSERGQAAVVVPVPAVESLVSVWRERFDSSAAEGMPAHITALYPFLGEDCLTDEVLDQLRCLCAQLPVLDVVFRRTGRFPGVLYLDPEPADGLRRLTAAIAERWPDSPPYGGRFQDVIPHLTVAHRAGDRVLADIEAELLRSLPVPARLEEAVLYVFDGRRWRRRARLTFRDDRGDR